MLGLEVISTIHIKRNDQTFACHWTYYSIFVAIPLVSPTSFRITTYFFFLSSGT